MIELDDRILLNDGTSVVNTDTVIEYLFEKGNVPDYIKTIETKDVKRFEKKFQTKITQDIEDVEIQPDTSFDEEELSDIVFEIYARKPDDVSDYDHETRFEQEMSYIIANDHQKVIVMLYHLVEKFKKDDVVWGVGRGSSVASYVLFLLGIHDINPIKYNINPKEFYKSFDE